jgi:hypothetical protein
VHLETLARVLQLATGNLADHDIFFDHVLHQDVLTIRRDGHAL